MKIVNEVYTVECLEYVRKMLSKYANAYNDAVSKDKMPSRRILKWVDYYNDATDYAPDVWKAFCTKIGRGSHDAYDVMA